MGGMVSVPEDEWSELVERVEELEYLFKELESNPIIMSILNYTSSTTKQIVELMEETEEYREKYDRLQKADIKNQKKLASILLKGAAKGTLGVKVDRNDIR